MAYYYVKNGLTGTGDQGRYASKQTGAFPTTTGGYPTILATFSATTPPASGDFICVSDSHTNTSGPAGTWAGPTGNTDAPIVIISVADANCDQHSAGASEEAAAGGGANTPIEGLITTVGLDITSGNHILVTSMGFTFINGNMGFWGGDLLYPTDDGVKIELINSNLTCINLATQPMLAFDSPTVFSMRGGSIISTAGGDGFVDSLTAQSFGLGGSVVSFVGVDLSIVDTILFKDVGQSLIVDDKAIIEVIGCKLHANVVALNEPLRSSGQSLLMTNSAATSGAAEYQYQYTTRGGDVNDETSIYRDSSTAFPSGEKTSLKCVSLAEASIGTPFFFDFPTRFADLSLSGTLRIYLQSNTQLYDSDVWAEVIYADGTNGHQPNYLSTRHDNLLDTNGTELSTNTQAWSGTAQTYQYHIDLDTTADPGGKGYPTVRVYVAKASTTIYFDSELVVT